MRASACAAAIYDSSFMGNWLASSTERNRPLHRVIAREPAILSLRGGAALSVIARSVSDEAISMQGDRHAPSGLAMTDKRSLRGGVAPEAISSQHEMTQLSYMPSPSPT